MNEQVASYYDAHANEEWARLEPTGGRYRQIEWEVTLHAMECYLPPLGRIVDIGAGPGRYSLELARRGYDVVAVDLSPRSLHLLNERAELDLDTWSGNLSVIRGDAVALPLAAEAFDGALLLGPLYHLTRGADRYQALIEATRVLRPGSPVLAAFVTRYAPLRDILREDPSLLRRTPVLRQILTTGEHHPGREGIFTDAYFAHPAEIRPLLESAHLEVDALIACESIAAFLPEAVDAIVDDGLWRAWLDLFIQVADDPSLLGASEHILAVAHKPGDGAARITTLEESTHDK